MKLFDDFSKKVTKSTQEITQKTKDIAEISKLNSQISDEQKQIYNLFTQIGEKYYSLYGNNPQEEFLDLCESINLSQSKVISFKNRIIEIKNIKTCLNCGAECSADVAFCSICGAELPKQEHLKEENISNKFCSNCGTKLLSTAIFCPECGYKVEN